MESQSDLQARINKAAYDVSLRWASHLTDLASVGLRHTAVEKRYRLSDAVLTSFGLMWRSRLPIIRRNFATMMSLPEHDPKVRWLALESLRNYGRMAMDFLAVRTMDDRELLGWCQGLGTDLLERALHTGRGAILALPHAGSWDVAAAVAQALGIQLTVITESNWANALVASSRRSKGVHLVPRDGGLRPIFRSLARNQVVAILSDIANERVSTIDVPFFGHPASFPTGTARIAIHTKSTVLAVSSFRLADNTYRIEARTAIVPDTNLSTDEMVVELTRDIVRQFEGMIREYPEQWYPFRPIWV